MSGFLDLITGSFAMPAAENPTVAMVEAAYRHPGLAARYLNCEVAPEALGDAVRGPREGVIGIRLWTGVDPDPAVMRRALEDALNLT